MKLSIKNLKEGWTQSEITMFDICPQKWNLNYNLLVSGTEPNIDFMVGSAWHRVMADMYTNGGEVPEKIVCKWEDGVQMTVDSSALLEHWQEILRVYAEIYAQHYELEFANLQVQAVEQEIDITFEWKGVEIRLRGVIDLRGVMGKLATIYDHKTFGQMSSGLAEGWDYRFQFMFYIWLVSKAIDVKSKRFVVNGMKKPTIRVRQNETTVGFYQRLRQDILSDKGKYFIRDNQIITRETLQKFESEVLAPKLNRIYLLQDITEFPREHSDGDIILSTLLGPNTGACYQYGKKCQYLGVCRGKIEAKRLPQRKIKHTEIVE